MEDFWIFDRSGQCGVGIRLSDHHPAPRDRAVRPGVRDDDGDRRVWGAGSPADRSRSPASADPYTCHIWSHRWLGAPFSASITMVQSYDMAKEKVTLTLDADHLAALRARVGSRSLSAAVDAAVAAYLDHLVHLAAVDEWLAELEAEHGPVPAETLEWAARLVEDWESQAAPSTPRRAS